MPVSDQAFVTLAVNDTYCQGALVLGQSLRAHRATRALVVLVTPQVSRPLRAVLRRVFDEVAEVSLADSAEPARRALLQRPELGRTLAKLHCWALTKFSKAVFLDADTLVLCNIDELFERSELSAAPDPGWPDWFNSAVFVFRPSLRTHGLLLQHAADCGSFDGADQGVLNSFFSGWATADIRKHLPFTYNLSFNAAYTYTPAFRRFGSRAKVVHFLGPRKPWAYRYNPQTGSVPAEGPGAAPQHQLSFLNRWWDVYHRGVLPLYGSAPGGPRTVPEEGPRNLPEGPRNIPEGTRNIPEVLWNVPEGPQNIPEEEPRNIPEEPQKIPGGPRNIPEEEPRKIPKGPRHIPEEPWNTLKVPQNVPEKPRNIPEEPRNIPEEEPRKIPGGSRNIPEEEPRNIPKGPRNIPEEPWNTLKVPQNVPEEPRNIPEEEPRKIPKGPRNIPGEEPRKIPEEPRNIPEEEPRKIPKGLRNIPEEPQKIPKGPRNIPEEPRNVPEEEPRKIPKRLRNIPEEPRDIPEEPQKIPEEPRNVPEEEPRWRPSPGLSVALSVSVSEIIIEEKARAPGPEEQRRRWEEGRIDYMGSDAFARIQEKLDRFLH